MRSDTPSLVWIRWWWVVVREHGRCCGFPVDAVVEVRAVVDPATAELAS